LYRWVDDKGVAHSSNRPPATVVADAGQARSVKKTAVKKKLYDFRERDIVEMKPGKIYAHGESDSV